MPRSARRQFEMFPAATDDADRWADRLADAFADAHLETGFLPLAEQAIAACPGDIAILMLAATAALLDGRPERALVYLKRLSKRASAPAEQLLSALALAQLDRKAAPKLLLDRDGFTPWPEAVPALPGRIQRLKWLIGQSG